MSSYASSVPTSTYQKASAYGDDYSHGVWPLPPQHSAAEVMACPAKQPYFGASHCKPEPDMYVLPLPVIHVPCDQTKFMPGQSMAEQIPMYGYPDLGRQSTTEAC